MVWITITVTVTLLDLVDPQVYSLLYARIRMIRSYDPDNSTIDLRYLRSTELPLNCFVHMSPPLKEDDEIKFHYFKRVAVINLCK